VAYWIEQSGLSRAALGTISQALGVQAQPDRLTREEREVLAWWGNPPDAMARQIRETARAWLILRRLR